LPDLLEREIRLGRNPSPQSLIVALQPGAAVSASLLCFHAPGFQMTQPIPFNASLRNLEPLGYGLGVMSFLPRQNNSLTQLMMIASRRHALQYDETDFKKRLIKTKML